MNFTTKRIALPQVVVGRTCGDCTACCVTHSVYELRKRTSERCPHLGERGCGIYESRPGSCRDFECLWLKGFIQGDERRRPDNLGLVFEMLPNKMGSGQVVYLMWAYEVWPGASSEPAGQYLLNKLARQYKILIRQFDGGKRFSDGDPVPDIFIDQQDLWDTPRWDKVRAGEMLA